MTKDDEISFVISKHGAFWAFSNSQFDEQKREGVKYISLGAGLVCPIDNAKILSKELDETIKLVKKEEKDKRDARAKALKIEKLPKSGRIENRKILIKSAISRVNNFMDDTMLADCSRRFDTINDTKHGISTAVNRLLSAIKWRYHDRADYEPDVKEVYDEAIKEIEELKNEIIEIIKE